MYLQNLTKKYRLYAACGDFPFIQLLNSRVRFLLLQRRIGKPLIIKLGGNIYYHHYQAKNKRKVNKCIQL